MAFDTQALYEAILSAKPFEQLSLEEKLYAMARVGSELPEISIELEVDIDTLQSKHREVLLRGYTKGAFELRQAMHGEAIYKGNQTMLKHLAAHRLKQIDQLIVTSGGQSPIDLLSSKTNMAAFSKTELIAMLKAELARLEGQE
jgi:hypothetical protein